MGLEKTVGGLTPQHPRQFNTAYSTFSSHTLAFVISRMTAPVNYEHSIGERSIGVRDEREIKLNHAQLSLLPFSQRSLQSCVISKQTMV